MTSAKQKTEPADPLCSFDAEPRGVGCGRPLVRSGGIKFGQVENLRQPHEPSGARESAQLSGLSAALAFIAVLLAGWAWAVLA